MPESATRKRRKPARPNKYSPTGGGGQSQLNVHDLPPASPHSDTSGGSSIKCEPAAVEFTPDQITDFHSRDVSVASGSDSDSTASQVPFKISKVESTADESCGAAHNGMSHRAMSGSPVTPVRVISQSAVISAACQMPNSHPLVIPPERSILNQYEELKSKAMTSRARRIIANARERNRVHTISSAFEELRRSIPCYSSNQKLSKLAILKIATSYIRCLGHVAGSPCSTQADNLSELVMKCTVDVLSDGKLKKDIFDCGDSRSGDDNYD